MGLFLKQDETRSQLSSRVSENLTQRLEKRALENDDSKSAAILQNHQKTTGGGLFWFIIITLVVTAVLVYLIFIF